jgi:hypothetical protein
MMLSLKLETEFRSLSAPRTLRPNHHDCQHLEILQRDKICAAAVPMQAFSAAVEKETRKFALL